MTPRQRDALLAVGLVCGFLAGFTIHIGLGLAIISLETLGLVYLLAPEPEPPREPDEGEEIDDGR